MALTNMSAKKVRKPGPDNYSPGKSPYAKEKGPFVNDEWNKFSLQGKFGSSEKQHVADVNDEIAKRFRQECNHLQLRTPGKKQVARRQKEAAMEKRRGERKEGANQFQVESLLGNLSGDDSDEEKPVKSESGQQITVAIEDDAMANAVEAAEVGSSGGGSNAENAEPVGELPADEKPKTKPKPTPKRKPPPPPCAPPPLINSPLGRTVAARRLSSNTKKPPPPPVSPGKEKEKVWPVSKVRAARVRGRDESLTYSLRFVLAQDLENVGMPQRKSVVIPPSSVQSLKDAQAAKMQKRRSFANATSSSFIEAFSGDEDEEEEDEAGDKMRRRGMSLLQRHSSSVGLEGRDRGDSVALREEGDKGGGGRGKNLGRGISIASLLSMDVDES
jgi:hypothetical protein